MMLRTVLALLLAASPALAHGDLDRIVTLPAQPALTPTHEVPVQQPGTQHSRRIQLWSAVRDVIDAETAVGTVWQPACDDLTEICTLDTEAFGRGLLECVDAAACRTALGAGTGGGSVTSVDGSGGTTGLSLTGGPITTTGTLTLGGTLDADNGGTGSDLSACTTGHLYGAASGAGTDCIDPATITPDTDTTCNDVAVSCLFAGSATEGGPAAQALDILVTPDATNTTYRLPFASTISGYADLFTDSSLTYNPSSNKLFADLTGNVIGNVTGNSSTATRATAADTIATATNADNTAKPCAFLSASSGDVLVQNDGGCTFNPSTNALAITGAFSGTSATLSGLTAGRVAIVGTAGLIDSDAALLWDTTDDRLTAGIFRQGANNAGGFYGAPTSGTNDYRLFLNNSNVWELRRNIGGVSPGTVLFSGVNLYPGASAQWDLGTASAGVAGVYFDDGGGDTARVVAPSLSSDITLTLPAATGTLARTDGDAIGQTTAAAGTFTTLTSNTGGSTHKSRVPQARFSSGATGTLNAAGGADTTSASVSLGNGSLNGWSDGDLVVIRAKFLTIDDGSNTHTLRVKLAATATGTLWDSTAVDMGSGTAGVEINAWRDGTTVHGYYHAVDTNGALPAGSQRNTFSVAGFTFTGVDPAFVFTVASTNASKCQLYGVHIMYAGD